MWQRLELLGHSSLQRRRASLAFGVALALHAACALVRFPPIEITQAPVVEDLLSIEVIEPSPVESIEPDPPTPPEPEPSAPPVKLTPEPAGGEPAAAREAHQEPPLEQPSLQPTVPEDTSAVTEETPEPEEDLSLEAMLADEFDDTSTFALPQPRAARKRADHLAKAFRARTTAGEKVAGVGTIGNGGGPGGPGHGAAPFVVKEKFVFGGPEGAFKADVCAVPRLITASIAAITECEKLLTFYADRINISSRNFKEGFPGIPDRVEWFAIKYTGPFMVRHTDVYTFRLVADDGAQLFIDGQLIVDNDGQHAPRSRWGRVQLTQGQHQLKLKYFQGPGARLALQLFVARQGRHEKTFRPEF